jgi:hypothetical protein
VRSVEADELDLLQVVSFFQGTAPFVIDCVASWGRNPVRGDIVMKIEAQ